MATRGILSCDGLVRARAGCYKRCASFLLASRSRSGYNGLFKSKNNEGAARSSSLEGPVQPAVYKDKYGEVHRSIALNWMCLCSLWF